MGGQTLGGGFLLWGVRLLRGPWTLRSLPLRRCHTYANQNYEGNTETERFQHLLPIPSQMFPCSHIHCVVEQRGGWVIPEKYLWPKLSIAPLTIQEEWQVVWAANSVPATTTVGRAHPSCQASWPFQKTAPLLHDSERLVVFCGVLPLPALLHPGPWAPFPRYWWHSHSLIWRGLSTENPPALPVGLSFPTAAPSVRPTPSWDVCPLEVS